ncbi:MAG: hypothetical protein QM648_07670 [Solirubrobacterales bacterium]
MKRIAMLTTLFVLAPAAIAGASTTFGTVTDQPVSDNIANCVIPAAADSRSCTVFQFYSNGPSVNAPGGLSAPSDGVITSWQTVIGSASGASIAVTPQVLQRITGPGAFDLHFLALRHGTTRDLGTTGGNSPFADRLPVSKGDFIAARIDLTNGAPGDAPYRLGHTPSGSSGNIIARFPALADGSSHDAGGIIAVSNDLFQLSATIEADVDGDGYGDETQDACPQRADVHTACPAPVITGFKFAAKKLKFTSDRAANRTLTIERSGKGHKSKGKCSAKAKSGKKCTAWKRVLKKSAAVKLGANSYTYKGKAGSYRATLVVTNAEGVKTTKTLKFKIKSTKQR